MFTSEQLAALIAGANSEDWTGAILCGYYAGLRLRDVADLQWNAINSEGTEDHGDHPQDVQRCHHLIHPQFVLWLQEQTQGIGKALAGVPNTGR